MTTVLIEIRNDSLCNISLLGYSFGDGVRRRNDKAFNVAGII